VVPHLQAAANCAQQQQQRADQHGHDGYGEAKIRWDGLPADWDAKCRVAVPPAAVDVVVTSCSPCSDHQSKSQSQRVTLQNARSIMQSSEAGNHTVQKEGVVESMPLNNAFG
jgi:hypothetical protein